MTRVLGISIGNAVANPQPDEASMRVMIRDMLQTLTADLKLLSPGLSAADEARRLFASGADAARARDYRASLTALMACAEAVARATRENSSTAAAAVVAPGTVAKLVRSFELAEAGWQTSRIAAIEGLDKLVAVLKAEEEPDLHEIAGIIQTIAGSLPSDLAEAIAALRNDAEAGRPLEAPRRSLEASLNRARAFVSDNIDAFRRCENNPWEIEVSIIQPIQDALSRIEACLSNM